MNAENIMGLFLQQSLYDCEAAFADAVADSTALSWDWLVITAASEAQAQAYRAQLDRRLAAGLLPRQTQYAVIPDPDGKRVGSGGATLHVLREIARADGDSFAEKRILVLHSGGDSQRIPQYSAVGKLFARVPRALRDGRASTLFDEFCIALSCVPARMNGGMLVMSGDVLLQFNALQIDLERTGAACLSIKAPVQTGTHHGVFLSDGHGNVQDFLHKQPEDVLRAKGAVNAQDMVDIDTGAIWMDSAHVRALHALVSGSDAAFAQFVNEKVRLSFYGDFVYPMSTGATLAEYLAQAPEGEMSDALLDCRRAIWVALGGSALALIRMAPAEFIHFGTTREWRDLMLAGQAWYGMLGWQRSILTAGPVQGYAAVNCIIHPDAKIAPGCALEDCRIGANAVIGEGCVLSNVAFDGHLPAETALHALPVAGGSVCARLYGVLDNPKEAMHMGQAIAEPLWLAQRHPVATEMERAIQAALSADSSFPRMSLKESFAAAGLPAILDWQEALSDEVRAQLIIDQLSCGKPVAEVICQFPTGIALARLSSILAENAKSAAFPLKPRLYYTLAQVYAGVDTAQAHRYDDACWDAIFRHMLHSTAPAGVQPQHTIILPEATASLPLRVNWGGGWSDTPPYCLEHGGTVLNASILLDGQRPVHALARRLSDPVIRIESDDLGLSRTYTTLDALHTGNPHDPHALCKAALVACGILPEKGTGPLAPYMQALGGGILLKTAVRGVPKGSGLGTSSIVAAAVAQALCRLTGQADDDARITTLTMLMEQLMQTGGGWQDQVGGLIPGIKLIHAPPGMPQQLSWRQIAMEDAAFDALQARSVLIYTGQRRMARGILREIMGKAIANNPETMEILSMIQRLAVLMTFELENGNIDAFAALLREHWALSKKLDAGSSNTSIDHMMLFCEDLLEGMMISGAGGGGFVYAVLRNGVPVDALRSRLAGIFHESGVRVWDAALVQ